MSQNSLLSEVDPEVISALCRDPTDNVGLNLSTVSSASALGLLEQFCSDLIFTL